MERSSLLVQCTGQVALMLRRQHGATQMDVAAAIGLSQAQLSRYEREGLSGMHILEALSLVYGLKPSEFMAKAEALAEALG